MRDDTKAKVYVESLIIPTYSEPRAEELPMFAENRVHQRTSGDPYPNRVVTSVNRAAPTDREYVAVRLENEYISVVILPEIGGRIYSAIDKTTGQEIFYKQHVIKPALIGVLGSWVSGGVEFNWPFHHRASGYMECDFITEGLPDGSVVCRLSEHDPITYSGAPCDYLGDNRFRVYFPPHEDKLRDAAVGMRLCIRHTLKGLGAIVLRDSDRTELRDITIRSAPCMAAIVLPRCHDLTIEGLRVCTEESGSYMACNTDGVHIAGLGGRLIMRDCIFDGMGDDSLNVHSTLGTVTRVKDSLTFVCNYCKKSPDGALPPAWCREGDTVRVYDPVSMKRTATLTVRSFEGGVLRAFAVDGRVSPGDVIQNMAMAPSAEISGCRVKNSVARGFIIQTDNVTLEDCELYGIASSAVKVAPDLDYWYEAGPTEHFYMRGNRMEKCSFARGSSVIEVQTNHMERRLPVTGLHRDIRIEKNSFVATPSVCVDVCSADGVCIADNEFEACTADELIHTEYCENVSVKTMNNI